MTIAPSKSPQATSVVTISSKLGEPVTTSTSIYSTLESSGYRALLVACGDFEGAIVTEDMIEVNQKDYQLLVDLLGKKNIHSMHYIPEYYEMRDRCKAVVQTGDYGVHAQAILIAGYPSAEISMKWLKEGM